MALRRPKHPQIYPTVANWWNNDNGVPYIAHAILTNGHAARLHDAVEGEGNQNFAINHPDQRYWARNQVAIRNTIQPHLEQIVRIEIDCALMPCTQQGGCVYRVPGLIKGLYNGNMLADKVLRIFSHRDENMGNQNGNASSKRYYEANTNDGNAEAMNRYNTHDGWGWVPWVNYQGYI